MRMLLATIAGLSLMAAQAHAADAKGDKEPTAQQLRMKDCNQKAAEKKGEERKTFMSSCLKA